jgi:large subunit ribosomal protein L10
MKKEEKKSIIDKVKKIADKSKVTILTDFRGMSVKSVTDLKRKLRQSKAELRIVKNTLLSRAIGKEQAEALQNLLSGPTAVIFGLDDPLAPVKVLATFVSENEKPQIKGGIFEGKFVSMDEIKTLSKLPGRNGLIAKVVGGIKTPLAGLVYVLKGNLNKLVYTVDAIKDKKGQ